MRSVVLFFLTLLLCGSVIADDPVTRTVGIFNSLDGSFSSYCRDGGQFPGSAGSIPDVMNALMSHSQTFCLRAALSADGWGNPLHYFYSEKDKPFFLISYGADNRADSGLYDSSGRPTVRTMENVRPEQDLICKHDLRSDNSCRL